MIIKSLVFRPRVPTNWPKMTRVLQCLFAVLLMLATRPSSGATSTASYEEMLAAVKSGSFNLDKVVKAKGTSEDILKELLEKSEFILFCCID